MFGEKIEGTWYDRAAFYEAERRGKQVCLAEFAVPYQVPLAPLPFLEGKSEAETRAFYRNMVTEIEQETHQMCMDQSRQLLGATAILGQDPHSQPRQAKRSPAPLCHASRKRLRRAYRKAYRRFVSLYRQAVERFCLGDVEPRFPQGCFLPPLLCPPQLTEASAPG